MQIGEAYRSLPAVHKLLNDPEIQSEFPDVAPSLLTELLALVLQNLRNLLIEPEVDAQWWQIQTSTEQIIANAKRELHNMLSSNLRPVINGTGTVIHTNLGRAPLSERAKAALVEIASTYSTLEYALDGGERGSRHALVEARLQALTGAEAACVVNNNAAAVLLVLRELASGGNTIVSRGQLVEIGGSFRIPDVMRESGTQVVEVGTTNKTRLSDYSEAMTPETKAILRVHTSNYRIIGFTYQPPLAELVRVAHEHGALVIEDLGSGALFDFGVVGIGDEPTVRNSIDADVDVLMFSGDKLLGGSQAGIIVGKKQYIDRIKKNPLMRALRVDKLTLAALDATLAAYVHPDQAKLEIPVIRMLTASPDDLAQTAGVIKNMLLETPIVERNLMVEVIQTASTIGGGALPETTLPTSALSLKARTQSTQTLFDDLRRRPAIPVIGRIERDRVVIDVRTVLPGQEQLLHRSVTEVLEGYEQQGNPPNGAGC